MELRLIDESDDYLSHHGVMGMKRGVRNEETLRKYAGGHAEKRVVKAKNNLAKAQTGFKANKTSGNLRKVEIAKKKLNTASKELDRENFKRDLKSERKKPGSTKLSKGTLTSRRNANLATSAVSGAAAAITAASAVSYGVALATTIMAGPVAGAPVALVYQTLGDLGKTAVTRALTAGAAGAVSYKTGKNAAQYNRAARTK